MNYAYIKYDEIELLKKIKQRSNKDIKEFKRIIRRNILPQEEPMPRGNNPIDLRPSSRKKSY